MNLIRISPRRGNGSHDASSTDGTSKVGASPTGRPGCLRRCGPSARIPPGGTTQVRDVLFVAVIIAASTVQYVARLGFASDDWAFLGSLTTHGDLSAPGRSVEHDFATYLRPDRSRWPQTSYDAFGPNLLGYHLVNAVVLAVMGALGYLVLRELAMPRLPAVGGGSHVRPLAALFHRPILVGRVWLRAAMMLALASMYADLRAVRSRGGAMALEGSRAGNPRRRRPGVRDRAAASRRRRPAVVVPLPPVGRWPAEQQDRSVGAAVFFGSNILVLSAIVAFKLAFAVGVGVDGNYVQHSLGWHSARRRQALEATASGYWNRPAGRSPRSTAAPCGRYCALHGYRRLPWRARPAGCIAHVDGAELVAPSGRRRPCLRARLRHLSHQRADPLLQ